MRTCPALRWVMNGLAATSLAAVLLGRAAPQTLGFRYDPLAYVSVLDGYSSGLPPRVLDARTGTLSALPLPSRHGLRWGSLSPWVDGHGERCVVGWWTRPGEGRIVAVPTACGLASVSFPGGRLVASVPDAPVPIGCPCWSPDTPARLFYPAGDGRIYCVDFVGIDAQSSAPVVIRPVAWSTHADPQREPFVESICWPDRQVFGGRLLAAVRFPEAPGQCSRPRLCWLTLGRSGTRITNVETISVGRAAGGNERGFTCASLCLASDGRCLVAFQYDAGNGEPHALWVASTEATELLKECVIPSEGLRLVADRVARIPAVFAPNGAAVYAVVASRERGPVLQRFALEPLDRGSLSVN